MFQLISDRDENGEVCVPCADVYRFPPCDACAMRQARPTDQSSVLNTHKAIKEVYFYALQINGIMKACDNINYLYNATLLLQITFVEKLSFDFIKKSWYFSPKNGEE